jgi:hypothetical protein
VNYFCAQCGVALPVSDTTPAEPVLVKAPMGPGGALGVGCLVVIAIVGVVLFWVGYEMFKVSS